MEAILKNREKTMVNEVFDLLKTLTPEEQVAIKYVIDGMKISRVIESRKK